MRFHLTPATDLHIVETMRRWLTIALMLLVWSAQSGVVLLAHDLETGRDHATAPHDESKCRICAAVHAPAINTGHLLAHVATLDPIGTAAVFDVEVRFTAPRLTLFSRGPPLA